MKHNALCILEASLQKEMETVPSFTSKVTYLAFKCYEGKIRNPYYKLYANNMKPN